MKPLDKLKQQYKQMLSKKEGSFYLEGYNKVAETYLNNRLFCLECELLTFNEIEMLEFEINQSFS